MSMSATVIVIDERGVPTVEIPDAEGELHHYSIAPLPEGLDDFAVEVERLDTRDRYRVSRWRNTWRCGCPAWKFAKGRPKLCKHVPEIARLESFLARMTTPATTTT